MGFNSPLGWSGLVILIIGLILFIIGIVILIVNQVKKITQPWYVWALIGIGIIMAIVGAVMLILAISQNTKEKKGDVIEEKKEKANWNFDDKSPSSVERRPYTGMPENKPMNNNSQSMSFTTDPLKSQQRTLGQATSAQTSDQQPSAMIQKSPYGETDYYRNKNENPRNNVEIDLNK